MLALGLLLEGHLFYPDVLRGRGALEDLTQPLQSLAQRIAFFDPVTGAERVFDSQRNIRFGRGQVVSVQDTGALVRKAGPLIKPPFQTR